MTTLLQLPALCFPLPCHFALSPLWSRCCSELNASHSWVSGQKCERFPPRGCASTGSVTIFSFSSRLSLSSWPMCWEWPGWAYLVSLPCPCLCTTTYGQLVKSSSHPRPTGQPVWSRSAWISDNTVLPLIPRINFYPLGHGHLCNHHDVFQTFSCRNSTYCFPQRAPFSEWKDHVGS